ncbi:hypothetical protein HYALB_00006031 [Hymenoscyphus albidus]|uniref:Uncharacterized protein n=1 Tax=Hymenoscyphus albidus TaxID=595503 RepID=A0A9N9QCP9_9HELO|nr:hypothetical protein HYALB_00006031 [Hymenoscyphus albidus]
MAPKSRRAYEYDDEASTSSGSNSEYEGTDVLQTALRDKEEALVQSALARIRKAREKGKKDVKLNQDELDALENRRKRMEAAAAKSQKSGASSMEKKKSKKVTVSIASIDPNIPTKTKSKSKRDTSQSRSSVSNPPGILIAGPDGPVYAPVGYYPPNSSSRGSPSRARSTSIQQPPPLYPSPLSNRHFSDGMRPTSSSSTSSRRPVPDDEGWVPGSSRRSSISSQNYQIDPFEYQTSSAHPPRIPDHFFQHQQQGRRNNSGPSEVSYSMVRRSPPAGNGYPVSSRGPASDPALRNRGSYRDELANSSSSDQSDELGNGAQVSPEERDPTPPKESRESRNVSRKPVGSSGRKKGRR